MAEPAIDEKKIRKIESLKSAAQIRADLFTPQLFQLLGYRQRLAQDILNMKTENFYYGEALADFDNCNDKIKQLLGL